MNRTCVIVFLSVFTAGLAMHLALNVSENSVAGSGIPNPATQQNRAECVAQNGNTVRSECPLRLPMSARNVVYSTDGWECSGEIDANFVSAFGQLSSGFQNLGWKPEKRISIDSSISPRKIFTFEKDACQLLLMLWKIDTDTTGFSYRRESKKLKTGNYNGQ